MKSPELPITTKYYKTAIPFSPAEKDAFKAFLKATGRKAGPWIGTLVVAAIASEPSPDRDRAPSKDSQ